MQRSMYKSQSNFRVKAYLMLIVIKLVTRKNPTQNNTELKMFN